MKKKQVARSKKVAVTFEMPSDNPVESLYVAGDFNDWSTSANPMKRLKDGGWSATVNLLPGTYRYRFVADGGTWLNDPGADRYEPSGFGEDNSVVVVE
jgi:1,4-alpha-glucan branching enzyme